MSEGALDIALPTGGKAVGETVTKTGNELVRSLTWVDAFWVSSGVPALVLFTIGSIAATVGNPSWAIWIISILFGFLQSFTYAEIAGLFPEKSGGASVYGAVAWVRYSKLIAPLSVWCNWFAWSPVLAIGTSLGAGYILSVLFPADSVVNSWQWTLFDLGMIKDGLTLRINATFGLAAVLMLCVFAIQHRGILASARIQMIFAVVSLLPLLIIGLVPLLTGDLPASHFTPFAPLAHDAAGKVVAGHWDMAGLSLMAGGLFIAAWSTYGFETAVCYTREFRNPSTDTFKAIFFSGLLCLGVFTLVPLAFQGALGLDGMLAPDIYSGMGVGRAMAAMIGAQGIVLNIIVVMLVLTLLLSIMTAMAGSSRTLYQGSVDGWLPRYLSHVNHHGAPTHAMWTDLCFNMLLLLLSDNVFVLAASNVGYIIFSFMNLNAGWLHRIDRPFLARPFKCPAWLLGTGAVLGFVNAFLMGMGAGVWGSGTLLTGIIVAAMVIPVFLFRHYVQDKGVFPEAAIKDLHMQKEEGVESRAGLLPYLALLGGVLAVIAGRLLSA
ncbi:APC family permease [Granulibacter bethesdensis]|uniref:APC family permease n=1 Tax=Granulibacter bethesdensis TaxID=364410 RepID=UPI0003F1E97A|nr:APC family permease [Granulibacter bethesdensis]AHJ65726.1 Amino acid permease [Granulibacter bethesdensis CGDNIH4]